MDLDHFKSSRHPRPPVWRQRAGDFAPRSGPAAQKDCWAFGGEVCAVRRYALRPPASGERIRVAGARRPGSVDREHGVTLACRERLLDTLLSAGCGADQAKKTAQPGGGGGVIRCPHLYRRKRSPLSTKRHKVRPLWSAAVAQLERPCRRRMDARLDSFRCDAVLLRGSGLAHQAGLR